MDFLSWNYWQNVDKISWHFGFVTDLLKIVCQFTTSGNFLCLSRVSTLFCLHQHVTIRHCIFIFYYFLAIFAKNSDDVSRVQISTEKIPRCTFRSLCKKISLTFSDTKDLQHERIKNAPRCIFPHFPLVPLLILCLLHFSFFWSK